MIPQPKPLKYGRGGKCDICGARGPLTEVSLPSKRHPVMVCIRCYRNIQMRYLFSKKDFDEDDEFQDKWRAENYSFENAVSNMLGVANHLGSVEAAREQWGAAPQVWKEVTRRFNESFNYKFSNYTVNPNCRCGATLQWSQKKRAWYCVECPFNTFKDAESFEGEDKYTQNIKNYGHKKWRPKGQNRPESSATIERKLEGFKLKPKCTALRSDGFVCGKPIQWDRRDLGDLCGTHHRQMQKREAKDQAESSKHRKEPYDYGPLMDWAKEQDFSAEDRPRDQKGRLVPKFGVAKWGNDYWGYGVTYQEWKYKHPASVRVFAEGYGVDLRNLSSEQKDWLKMRYEEDIDSKTSLIALIDEFNLSARGLRRFRAEDRPEEERMTRPQAEALATKMIGLLQPSCEFIEVCGSFRRGREDPGDLDIVVILKPRETLPKIVEDLEEEHTAVNWLGEKKTQIIVDGVKVDIRVTTDRAKGAALLYFTGPAGYNIGIRRAAKSRGMKLNEYGIWTRDTNEYLGGATEEEIYEVLGKNFRPATERRAETEEEFEKRYHISRPRQGERKRWGKKCPFCDGMMGPDYHACARCRKKSIHKMTKVELKYRLAVLDIAFHDRESITELRERLRDYRKEQEDEIFHMDKPQRKLEWFELSERKPCRKIIIKEEDVKTLVPIMPWESYGRLVILTKKEGWEKAKEIAEAWTMGYLLIWYSEGTFHIELLDKSGNEFVEWQGDYVLLKDNKQRLIPILPQSIIEYEESDCPISPSDYTDTDNVEIHLENPIGESARFLVLEFVEEDYLDEQIITVRINDEEGVAETLSMQVGLSKDAETFNSAVIFPSSYRTAGPLEKAVINNVMMAEIRLQEALLTLESHIKMGLISEQEALKTFMKIVG